MSVSGPGAVSDADTASFHAVRPRLFGIAYRVLGDASEAEDVVQDTWIRWQTTDRTAVRDVPAFLATTTTRIAINVIQSARARHETSVGPQIAETVDGGTDAWRDVERREALELAIRELLEKLSPVERGAYLLHEAFDYRYRDVAAALDLREANARQLVTRARRRLAGGPRWRAGAAEQARLLGGFTAAAQAGDLASLEQLLNARRRCHESRRRPVLARANPTERTVACRAPSSSSTAPSPSRPAGAA